MQWRTEWPRPSSPFLEDTPRAAGGLGVPCVHDNVPAPFLCGPTLSGVRHGVAGILRIPHA